jgi:hypothetical protein
LFAAKGFLVVSKAMSAIIFSTSTKAKSRVEGLLVTIVIGASELTSGTTYVDSALGATGISVMLLEYSAVVWVSLLELVTDVDSARVSGRVDSLSVDYPLHFLGSEFGKEMVV